MYEVEMTEGCTSQMATQDTGNLVERTLAIRRYDGE